jgi:hypothetical protein
LHLTRAAEALEEALKRALESLRWSEARLAAILPPLRACERELHLTTAALESPLPRFEARAFTEVIPLEKQM